MTLDKNIRAAVRKHLSYALEELLDAESLWAEIYQIVQESLDDNASCHLRFDDGRDNGVEGLVGIHEATQYVAIFWHCEIGPLEDMPRQLRGLDKFIAQLQECRAELEAEIAAESKAKER